MDETFFSKEMYWRIPGSWQANDLRKRISLLNDGLNENLNTGNFNHLHCLKFLFVP